MTVGIILGNIDTGGAQRVAITLATWLNEHHHKAVLIVLSNSKWKAYTIEGIETAFLENIYKGKSIKNRIQLFNEENAIDEYLVMDVPMCIYVIPALKRSKARIVVSERSDPRHAKIKLPVKIMSRLLMSQADGFVFQTEEAKNYYKRLANKSIVIPNPVMEIPVIANRRSNCERKKEIVTAGRLIPAKNHKMLLSAFKKISSSYPDYKLIIYGDGLLLSELKSVSKDLGIDDKVEFPGSVNDLHERIKESELFVMTSDFEGMPNALMEAMAMGLTCISTDCPCGGPKQLISDGENGYLIPVGDISACAEKIEYTLTHKEEADIIADRAMGVREKYGKDTICAKWLSYLQSIYEKC